MTFRFQRVGVPVATRTTSPPKLDEAAQAAFVAKAKALVPRYRTELLASSERRESRTSWRTARQRIAEAGLRCRVEQPPRHYRTR